MTAEANAIRALLADRYAAISAGDVDAAAATTADGAVIYDLAPPLSFVHERSAAIAGTKNWLGTWAGPISLTLADLDVKVSGDLAVAHGFSRLRGTSKSGERHDSWFRTSTALERQADGWRIIHEHSSYPMRMDGTELAATDLKPEEGTEP